MKSNIIALSSAEILTLLEAGAQVSVNADLSSNVTSDEVKLKLVYKGKYALVGLSEERTPAENAAYSSIQSPFRIIALKPLDQAEAIGGDVFVKNIFERDYPEFYSYLGELSLEGEVKGRPYQKISKPVPLGFNGETYDVYTTKDFHIRNAEGKFTTLADGKTLSTTNHMGLRTIFVGESLDTILRRELRTKTANNDWAIDTVDKNLRGNFEPAVHDEPKTPKK